MKSVVVTLKCPSCHAKNRFRISVRTKGIPICGKCRHELCHYQVVSGYIYILSNPAMPGLLKIGCTDRSIKERVQELNSATGVPTPFEVEAVFFCSDSLAEEKLIHSSLEEHRVEGKEFFRIALVESLQTIERVLNKKPYFEQKNKICFRGFRDERERR